MILGAITLALAMTATDIPRGCYRVSEEEVKTVPHGFWIVGPKYFVHDRDVSRSGDAFYWVCTVGDKHFHLFVPPSVYEELFR